MWCSRNQGQAGLCTRKTLDNNKTRRTSLVVEDDLITHAVSLGVAYARIVWYLDQSNRFRR